MSSTAARPRHRTPALVLTAVAAIVTSLMLSAPSADAAAAPTFGLLGPTSGQLTTLAGSHVTKVSLSAGWDVIEPSYGSYNTSTLAQLQSQVSAARNAGYSVVLDLGLQYPPSWVFSLPGQTRFVDQYGDTWHGSLSQDVPNAVFNPYVRAVEADYIKHLAAALGPTNFSDVRVGGLLSGELRYPPNTFNGHQDLLWDYDPVAQASAPVRGWKPGSGTAAQIQSSLNYYFASLTNYQSWMMQTVGTYFPKVDQQVMLPSWGLRPGMVTDAVTSGMRNQSVAEVNGLIASGLDWANQVKAIATSGQNATVYTTWLDAPQQNTTVQGIAPVDYLATLAQQYRLPLAGENTGGGGTAALQLCLQRVAADHLTGMMYMSGSLIDNGSAGVALSDLTSAAASLSS